MTDHLERYRQLARAIKFAPPQGQHERSNRLVHQPVPLPSLQIQPIAQVARPSSVPPASGPAPDPSEHAEALVRAAVSKHTVLPVTHHFQENIGDRINRLATSKHTSLPIATPKIPAPDPNWTPPTPPPVIQHLVSAVPIAKVIEDESAATEANTPASLNQTPSTVVETEDLSPQTESVDLNEVSTDVVETEDLSSQTESVDLEPTSTSVEPEPVALIPEEDAGVSEPDELANQKSQGLATSDNIAVTESEPEAHQEQKQEPAIEQMETSAPEAEPVAEQQTKTPEAEKTQVAVCPDCKSRELRKNGRQKNKQKYLCKDCGRQFVWSESVEETVTEKQEVSQETKPSSKPETGKSKSSIGKSNSQVKGFGRTKKRK